MDILLRSTSLYDILQIFDILEDIQDTRINRIIIMDYYNVIKLSLLLASIKNR